MKLWNSTPPRTNARVAAVIADAFATAKVLDPAHQGFAPRDVANALRFAMTTDAGAYLDQRKREVEMEPATDGRRRVDWSDRHDVADIQAAAVLAGRD